MTSIFLLALGLLRQHSDYHFKPDVYTRRYRPRGFIGIIFRLGQLLTFADQRCQFNDTTQ